jgi:hypothetical protein
MKYIAALSTTMKHIPRNTFTPIMELAFRDTATSNAFMLTIRVLIQPGSARQATFLPQPKL